jgi:GT2 family glycosyltransferase
VAQYKNLFHHYVHQTASQDAGTFWGACGAMKRDRYLALRGFDVQRYRRPSIEDIELGYRLKQAGGRIRLAKDVQVKHLKAWTLPWLLRADIFYRGIPWTQLLLRDRVFTADLNLQTHNRVSVVAVYGLLLALLVALWHLLGALVAALLALLLVWLNFDLYRFFARKRGVWFALCAIPLHWLYYLYNAVSFAIGVALYLYEQLHPESVTTPDSVPDRMNSDGS